MSKIMILANSDIGLYKFRKELIEELLNEHEVLISLPKGQFVNELIDLGCKFIETDVSRRGTNPFVDFKLIMKYKKILKQIKPDVVLTYTIKPNVYGGMVCSLLNIPYIVNVTGLGTAVENSGVLQKITVLLYKTGLRKASCVLFQNEENAKFAKTNKIVKGNQKLIPGSGVNLDYYKPLEYPSDKEIHFLFISRVMKQKGIDQYLDAAEYIKNKNPKTHFHILGFCEEAYENKLNLMQQKGIIEFHGMQSDVKKFHEISHCTVHPSYYPEGMSNVLLESAACGRPIITTDKSGCKEIVDDKVNGRVVEQKNSRDLINKIESFLNLSYQEKKQMGLAGRQKVEKEFDRNIVINLYKREIKKVLSETK